MKKIILLIGAAVLLIGGITYGITSTNATSKQDPVIEKEVEHEEIEMDSETETEEFMEAGAHEAFTASTDYETFEEYQAITDVIEEEFEEVRVVKDNKRNRVLLFVNDKGHTAYKSIYVKKTNRLKVIDFNGGLIFNDILAQETANKEVNKADTKRDEKTEPAAEKPVKKETKSNNSSYAEHAIVKDHIDLNAYNQNVVEDNDYKRVILYEDTNSHKQYKSIYLKKKDHLKVIDFNGGLIFNDFLTKDTAKQAVKKTNKKHHKHEEKVETAAEKPAKKETKSNNSSYAEHAIVKDHIDLNAYNENVVEDNDYKRVILYEDANSHKQYKSIYLKKKDHLKVIDFNGGLLYNGQL